MSYYELPAEQSQYFSFERHWIDIVAHFHSAPEFVFLEKGRAEVNVGGESRVLLPGDACFSGSFAIHSYTSTRDTQAYVLLGDAKYFDRFFRERGNATLPKFFFFSDFALLADLMQICNASRKSELNRQTICRAATEMLLGTLAETVALEKEKQDKQSNLVCEILKYAQKNIGSDGLSLPALSKNFGYSQDHLSKILHKYVSENWNSYVNRIRAERAKELLESGMDKNVTEIAYECGFNSANTFYRAYKKVFGDLPKRKNE